MTFLPASVIDGARTYAEAMRRLLYAATGGQTGVALPGDLVVSALPTPGPAVFIGPGTASIVSTFPGAAGQSYQVTNDQAAQFTVPANNTSSSIAYRVCVAVRDPQYPGQPIPSNPLEDTYLDVLIGATFPPRPHVHLGDIAMPANTSVVNPAAITDRRTLAKPSELTVPVTYYPGTNLVMSKTAYTAWAGAPQTVFIPPWTTHIIAEAHINGVDYTGTDDGRGGVKMLMNNSPVAQNGIIGSRGKGRQSLFVVNEWRLVGGAGTNAQFSVQGYQTGGTGTFTLDYQSQVLFRITFQQRIS